MRPGLLVSDRHSLCLVSVLIYRSWRSHYRSLYTWGPPVHLYCPLGCQEGSRLGGWSNSWPLSHNPQSENRCFKRRCQWYGDIELTGYLVNHDVTGPMTLVLDLRITHHRWGSSSDPSLNFHLHYPNDVDRSLNEAVVDKIRKYRSDYNNNPPTISPQLCLLSLVRLGGYIVNLCSFYFYKLIGKLAVFLQVESSSCGIKNWTLPLLDSSTSAISRSVYRRLTFSVTITHGFQGWFQDWSQGSRAEKALDPWDRPGTRPNLSNLF
jgi:hypothetical protein